MKTVFSNFSAFRLILALGVVLALGACVSPAASPTALPTVPPPQDTPVTVELATIRGTITYQGMPTPAPILYFISPQQSYSVAVPTGNPSAAFEFQAAGRILPDHRLSCWHTGPGCPPGCGLLAGRLRH